MSTSNELTGKITHIFDTQTFSSGFQKREFVVNDNADKYPQSIKFETVKEGCDRLDGYKVGDAVTVKFNIRGNEYNGKFYVSLQCWRIEKDGQETEPRRATSQNGAKPPTNQDDEEFEDVPF